MVQRILITTTLLIGLPSMLFAQTQETDSLRTYLKNDTIRVNLLNAAATKIISSNAEKGLQLYKEAGQLSDALQYKKGKAYSVINIGKAQALRGDFSGAIEHYRNALAIYEQLKNEQGIADCYSSIGRAYYNLNDQPNALENLKRAAAISEAAGELKILSNSLMVTGMIYNAQGDYNKSLDFYNKALAFDKKSGNVKGMSAVLINLGNQHKQQGDYTLALEAYNKSLELKKQLADDYGIASNLNNIGALYQDMDNLKAALSYFQKALPLFEKLNRRQETLGCLGNIGLVLMYQNNPEALLMFKKALRLSEQAVDPANTSNATSNLGAYYYLNHDYDTALQYYQKSLKLQQQLGARREMSNSYLNIARIYTAKKEYEKALEFTKLGTAIAKELSLLNYQADFALLLSEIYYGTKQYKLAYESRQMNNAINDSIYKKENIDKLAQIKYKYLHKGKENSLKNKVLQKDSELETSQQQKMWWIAGAFTLLVTLGLVLALVKIRKVRMENKQLLTEQKLRRSQMNPHFIFNSIQNVRSLIKNEQQDEAVNYLNKFSKLTRQILESSDENYTSLADEIELIKNYVSIQQLLYANAFECNIIVDEAIDTESTFLPPMLTQPFIENAIKHGLSNKHEGGKLEIRFKLNDAKLYFEVTDNGEGFDPQKEAAGHKSMAMAITKQRLVHYTKDPDFEVRADNITDAFKNILGAKVSFEIPYIYEN